MVYIGYVVNYSGYFGGEKLVEYIIYKCEGDSGFCVSFSLFFCILYSAK